MKRLSACLIVLAVACGPSVGGGGSGSGESGGSSESSSSESGLPDTGTGGPNVCGDGQLGDEGFCLSEPVLIDTSIDGRLLETGDIDGAGGDDLLVGQPDRSRLVSLFGDAESGLLAGPITEPLGLSLNTMRLADIDGEAPDDLLLTYYVAPEIWIELGDGSGEFTPTTPAVAIEDGYPSSMRAVDWSGDGRLDLLIDTESPGGVASLEQTEVGRFEVAQYGATGSNDWGPFNAGGVAAGNFGGAAGVDLAALVVMICDFSWSVGLQVYLDNATDPLEFMLPQAGTQGNPPESADLDGDGTDEIVTGGDHGLAVFGVRDGELTQLYADEERVLALAVGELDGDGLPEVILADAEGLRILSDWSADVPNQEVRVPLTGGVQTIAIADFNNDGLGDVAGLVWGDRQVVAIFSNP